MPVGVTKHELYTPSFALTVAGLVLLPLGWAKRLRTSRWSRLSSASALGLVGAGGTALALAGLVERNGYQWDWYGILSSLHKPDKQFWLGFATHFPQLLLAGWLFSKEDKC